MFMMVIMVQYDAIDDGNFNYRVVMVLMGMVT